MTRRGWGLRRCHRGQGRWIPHNEKAHLTPIFACFSSLLFFSSVFLSSASTIPKTGQSDHIRVSCVNLQWLPGGRRLEAFDSFENASNFGLGQPKIIKRRTVTKVYKGSNPCNSKFHGNLSKTCAGLNKHELLASWFLLCR